MVLEVLGLVLSLVVIIGILNMSALKRMFNAMSAQAGKAGHWAEDKDPVAMFQAKIDEAGSSLKSANQGLIQVETLIKGITRQIQDATRESARLDVRIKSALAENNEDRAADLAHQLVTSNNKLTKLNKDLADYKQTYDDFLRQVKAAEDKIATAKSEAASLGAELELSKTQAALEEATSHITVDEGLSDLATYRGAITHQIDENQAKSKVLHDLNADKLAELDEQEKIRKQEAKELLEKYKADHAPKATNE